MAKKDRVHLVGRDDLIRSVLLHVTATTECGTEKVFTREDVDSIVGRTDLRACSKCYTAVGDNHRDKDVTIYAADGWTALLERAWMQEHPDLPRPFSWTWTMSPGAIINWFPNAA